MFVEIMVRNRVLDSVFDPIPVLDREFIVSAFFDCNGPLHAHEFQFICTNFLKTSDLLPVFLNHFLVVSGHWDRSVAQRHS